MAGNRRAAAAACLLALSAFAATAQAGVVREDIVFLHADGRHYTAYKTVRSDIPTWRLSLEPGERPEDYVYIHPANYERERKNGRMVLTFEPGSYAIMRTGRFPESALEHGADGRISYRSWDGETLPNGHFGKWTVPGDFERFAYIWVFPDNIEILDYVANRGGDWNRLGNTLAWSGSGVNDLTFDIAYRVREPAEPESRRAAPRPASGESERITLDSTNLFPSGSHELTEAGEEVVLDLAERLAARDPARVIVEGHTDDQPLKPYLRKRYPSNWELSAARATMVVRRLAENGVDPSILEARAYGEQRPIADNDTAAGRAKNRRIEILVEGGHPAEATAGSEPSDAGTQSASDTVDTGNGSGTGGGSDTGTDDRNGGGQDGGFAR
ncbi:OmpA/MotB domain-containing protein [Salinisphaera sp. PC39]|uniref:OmpA/MotB family protein n=1 Tax=Salinisphaera sp. PC39 TaxID=1304156 RepID=UPI00333E89E8